MTSVLIWTGGFNLDKQLPGIYRRDIVGEGMMIPPEVILEVESESAKIGFLGMAYCEVILVAIAILTWGICFLNTVNFLCCDQHHTMNCIPQDRGIQPPQLLMAFWWKSRSLPANFILQPSNLWWVFSPAFHRKPSPTPTSPAARHEVFRRSSEKDRNVPKGRGFVASEKKNLTENSKSVAVSGSRKIGGRWYTQLAVYTTCIPLVLTKLNKKHLDAKCLFTFFFVRSNMSLQKKLKANHVIRIIYL